MNTGLISADISLLLDGNRYTSSIETGHLYEQRDSVWERGRDMHRRLAQIYGWEIVDANQEIETVHQKIYEHVLSNL